VSRARVRPRRLSGAVGALAAFLGSGCAAPDHRSPAPTPPPGPAGASAQAPDYGGYAARLLPEPVPELFRLDAARLRQRPEYAAIAAPVRELVRPDLDIAGFEALLGQLLLAADGIGEPKARAAVVGRLAATADALRLSTASSLWAAFAESKGRLDDFALQHAADPPAGCRLDGYLLAGRAVAIPFACEQGGGVDEEGRPRGASRWFAYLDDRDAWIVVAVFDLVHSALEANLQLGEVAAKLRQNRTAWDDYLRHGYPQFPWEELVNDRLVASAWDRPPDRQFVFLHAEPGVVFDLQHGKSTSLDAALLVHAAGHLWYFGDDRGWYAGASATAAITSDEDHGLGYGVTLHFGRSVASATLPAVSIGVLWHEGTGAGERGLELSIGVDVLRLLR
jgi:hypothetical protein